LATGGIGTALGVIVTAWEQGRRFHVFADETRPLLQGARLTAWELTQRKIPVTVLADAAAAHLLKTKHIGCCIVGADRITANGDTANKIGTYGLALLAKAHNVPFFVAAPSSTFDLALQTGDKIPIEERDEDEILQPFGFQSTPAAARGYNPAFDVTPAQLITAIITERGIIRNVNTQTVADVLHDCP
jgi:methylthioribose-1-phosphate isomerase